MVSTQQTDFFAFPSSFDLVLRTILYAIGAVIIAFKRTNGGGGGLGNRRLAGDGLDRDIFFNEYENRPVPGQDNSDKGLFIDEADNDTPTDAEMRDVLANTPTKR